jgi:ArsR family transcriptional regulator, arsenate/arsenite/antimonite-responsive transcriptional repressor / arsenate reductase (thioredoxin)
MTVPAIAPAATTHPSDLPLAEPRTPATTVAVVLSIRIDSMSFERNDGRVTPDSMQARAARHAALGDPARLAIVDELVRSDRAPVELGRLVGMPSNLLAHHLEVLEGVGLISRTRSSGDGRRRYVHLLLDELDALGRHRGIPASPALFVCSANSARSQLAAALWTQVTHQPATSAGTHPAERVHPKAVDVGREAGLDLSGAVPRALDEIDEPPATVVTVCDRAHEELPGQPRWLHWSVPDPVPLGTPAAFRATVAELRQRITALVGRRDDRPRAGDRSPTG